MGALNQISSAVSNFVQAPAASVSTGLAELAKPAEAVAKWSTEKPLEALAVGTGAYFAAPYLMGALGGAGSGAAGAAGTAAAADLAAAYGATGAGVGVGTLGGIGGAGLAGAGLAGAASGAAGSAAGGLLSGITPTQAILGAGLAAKALGGSSTPSSSTSSTSIDPDIKAAYLQQLADARTAAAGLGTRQFEGFTPGYATAEQQLTATGIGGTGQQTTNRAAELALAEAGYTPQQIAAAQASRANIANVGAGTGSQFMGAYQNPFEQQVVQGTLADIERQRQISQQAQQARAVGARAFGGSRQAVAESIANEDYMRQAANTAAQLRSAGFTTAAGLGQTDAARALQAQLANQGVDLTLEQANAQLRQQAAMANQNAYAQGAGIRQTSVGQLGALGAQQQNLGMTGAQAVMTAEQQRQQLAQARLDAARNLASERLGLTGSALGQNVPNLGGTTTTPIYRNQLAGGLGGALGGAQLGSILGGAGNPQYAGYGAILGGLLGLG
jgi:hypothetical protein